MIALDEDALICDLAETYHIYDYRSLPLQRVAIFCIGLREDSRIKKKISGNKHSIDTLLLASVTDYLSLILWTKTKDGQKGINRPASVLNQLLGSDKENDVTAFNSAEEFEAARKEIIEGSVEAWN